MKTVCPGCALALPEGQEGIPDRFHASGECWALFMELTAYHLSGADPTFIHQIALDAYGAQHSGGATRSITTAYSCIGLYLALEHNYTGRRVQGAHMVLARKRTDWPQLRKPQAGNWLTVRDVVALSCGAERDRMLMRWAASVWQAWQNEHEWVRSVCQRHLNVGPP